MCDQDSPLGVDLHRCCRWHQHFSLDCCCSLPESLLEALHQRCRGPRTARCTTAGGGASAAECISQLLLTRACAPLLQVGKDTDEPGYLKDRLSTMNDQETSNLLWSFAKFGYHPLPLVPDFLAAIDRVSSELQLQTWDVSPLTAQSIPAAGFAAWQPWGG